jgi:hypothetical protein
MPRTSTACHVFVYLFRDLVNIFGSVECLCLSTACVGLSIQGLEARDPLVRPERRPPVAFGVLDSGFVVGGLGFWGFGG